MVTQDKATTVLDWWHRCLSKWIAEDDLSTKTGSRSGKSGFQLDTLAGDGSQRTFYRIFRIGPGEASSPQSFVLLSDPAWQLSKDYAPHQAYLRAQGLPVPAFHFEDVKEGFLVMEDLGDELLQFRIQKEPENRRAWLERAVVLLAEMHGKTFPVPAHLPVASRSFDAVKYGEELRFTAEHLLEGYLGLGPLPERQRQAFEKFSAHIAAVTPLAFSHRDYHCRNLLVHQNRLVLIDFQDARLGPPHYDLASLLFDAYVPITDEWRRDFIGLYRQTLKPYALTSAIHWDTFERDLRQIAFQRVIKAAGSFASFFTRFGKATHLPYLIPALQSAVNLQKQVDSPETGSEFFPCEEWLKRAQQKGGGTQV